MTTTSDYTEALVWAAKGYSDLGQAYISSFTNMSLKGKKLSLYIGTETWSPAGGRL